MSPLSGGVAVVAGGAGLGAGLGFAMAREFARQGMRVAVLDVDAEAAGKAAMVLQAEGATATGFCADVTDLDSLRIAAAGIKETFGQCNVLCAHVGGGGMGTIDELSPADWMAALDLMVGGTINTVEVFLPLVREASGNRHIVLTASIAALAPGRFQGPYRAAKAAVTSFGETLRRELEPEAIGTTIVFPSGMLPPELADFVRTATEPVSAGGLQGAIAEEMAPDLRDIATGEEAARHIVAAVEGNEPYVITHGVTARGVYEARHTEILDAFTRMEARNKVG
jgi:NAD(P)-dependent dehydrogenase (short-subunit alcohol dehydrogenase family)